MPQEVLNEVYDLFIDLDAGEDQLDFPVLYTNAKAGTASLSMTEPGTDLQVLFDTIISTIPQATGDPDRGSSNSRHQPGLFRLSWPPGRMPRFQWHAEDGRRSLHLQARSLPAESEDHQALFLHGIEAG